MSIKERKPFKQAQRKHIIKARIQKIYDASYQNYGAPKITKSSLMIFDKHANLKYKYGNRQFWCKGYYVDTVGRNKKAIQEYIKNQLKEDYEYDQMSLKEYIDPFTGEPVQKN